MSHKSCTQGGTHTEGKERKLNWGDLLGPTDRITTEKRRSFEKKGPACD